MLIQIKKIIFFLLIIKIILYVTLQKITSNYYNTSFTSFYTNLEYFKTSILQDYGL